MKHFTIIVLMSCLLAACTKQNGAADTVLNEMLPADSSSSANAKYSGSFGNGPFGTVSGKASVYLKDGKYLLALEGVSVSNGPDLHVYLSKEVQPINFIDLGKLKSTNGNQLYEIPGTPDFSLYTHALIHCQQYNHLFGSAMLK
jgi:hypothetical protein